MGRYHSCLTEKKLSDFSTLNGKLENIATASTLMFIIFSNVMLLYGLYKTKSTKGFTNRMFIIISIQDLVCGCSVIPIYFAGIYINLSLSSCAILNDYEHAIYTFCTISTTICTGALGVDRFVFIRYPFKHTIFIKTKTLWLIVIFSYFVSGMLELSSMYFDRFLSSVAILIIMIVIVVSVTLNVILVNYIRRQTKEIRRLSNTYIQTSYQRKATNTVLIITTILVLFNLPQIILLFATFGGISYQKPQKGYIYIVHNWTRLLILINSGLNALIYIYRNQKAMNMYKKLLKNTINKIKL